MTTQQSPRRSLPRRALKALFWLATAVVLVIEDWLWEPLTRWVQRLARLPLLRQLSAVLARLPPYAAALVFLVPLLLFIPVKVFGLWLIGRGEVFGGLTVFLGAKLVGTALVAWIYSFTHAALLTLPWFAALHDWVNLLRQRVRSWIRARPEYRALTDIIATVRIRLRHWANGSDANTD